jgi:hypothetical protein
MLKGVPIRQFINYSKAVMSHVRDVTVIHTIDNRIFFDIPLNFEQGAIFKEVRIEGGRMIIKLQKSSVDNNGTGKLD